MKPVESLEISLKTLPSEDNISTDRVLGLFNVKQFQILQGAPGKLKSLIFRLLFIKELCDGPASHLGRSGNAPGRYALLRTDNLRLM